MMTKDGKPPRNTTRVYRWADLPSTTGPATYRITNPEQEPFKITVSKQTRQVLEGLIAGPLLAASYCRLSDKVLPLRRDHRVEIETEIYKNDAETGRERYGVYVLTSKVERITGKDAA